MVIAFLPNPAKFIMDSNLPPRVNFAVFKLDYTKVLLVHYITVLQFYVFKREWDKKAIG